ncbi:MAG: MBL fold metallo-hydrolase [Pseudomonadota bacterium]
MSKLAVTIVPVTPLQQNCAILADQEAGVCVIVDPGGDIPLIRKGIEQVGATPQAIWLTHGHVDHAAGARELADALSVDIIGPHKADAPLLENIAQQGEMFGMPGAQNVTPDRWLSDGETLECGGISFDVRHCPGHAPGHVIFVGRGVPFAVVGDVLFDGSVGRTDLPQSNPDDLMNSLRTHILPLADNITFICGHGPASTIGEQRARNPFLQRL